VGRAKRDVRPCTRGAPPFRRAAHLVRAAAAAAALGVDGLALLGEPVDGALARGVAEERGDLVQAALLRERLDGALVVL